MFPELITISDLNVGKTFSEIMLQSKIIYVLVVGKLIGQAVVSSVNVAEENKLRLFVEGNAVGIFVCA